MLKFKRVESGKYQAESQQGLVKVWNSKKDGNWYYSINNDKGGKKDTYANAKLAVEKVLNKPKTLKQKLEIVNSYVVGAEFFGCVNSGSAATILHMKVNDFSYYIVGIECHITDVYVYKYPIKIKRMLMSGNFTPDFICEDGKVIKIFSNFKDAEKTFKKLNQKTIDWNNKALTEIKKAKKIINENNGDMTNGDVQMAYFTLNDYGA